MPQGLGLQLPYAVQALDDLVRRRMLDRLAAEERAERIRQFNVQASERERAARLNEQLRRDQLESLDRAREGQWADRMIDESRGEFVDEPTQRRLQAAGYGQFVTPQPLAPPIPIAELTGDLTTPGRITGYERPPSRGFLREGSRSIGARELATQRANIEREKIEGANERAQAALEARQYQEQIANQFRQQGLNIQGIMATIAGENAARARERFDAETKATADKKAQLEQGARDLATDKLRTLGDLLTPEGSLTPGAKWVFGGTGRYFEGPAEFLSGAARAAIAARAKIVGQETLERLQELRRLSPTGGALGNVSDADIQLLRQSATVLTQKGLPEDVAIRELKQLRSVWRRIAGQDGQATMPPEGTRGRQKSTGRPVVVRGGRWVPE
jgi:hypothetical protein